MPRFTLYCHNKSELEQHWQVTCPEFPRADFILGPMKSREGDRGLHLDVDHNVQVQIVVEACGEFWSARLNYSGLTGLWQLETTLESDWEFRQEGIFLQIGCYARRSGPWQPGRSPP
jgi:hypothetical protein